MAMMGIQMDIVWYKVVTSFLASSANEGNQSSIGFCWDDMQYFIYIYIDNMEDEDEEIW